MKHYSYSERFSNSKFLGI